MPIDVTCPGCGRKYKVPEAAAGKSVRCRACQKVIPVPDATVEDDFGALELDDFGDEGGDDPYAPPPASTRKTSRSKGGKKTKKSAKSSGEGLSTGAKVGIGLAAGVTAFALCCGGAYWMVSGAIGRFTGGVEVPEGQSFEQWRAGFQTKLITRGPAPQEYEAEPLPPNVEEVLYPSGGMQLKAWVYRPPGEQGPRPALVFFHGGFAFGAGDLMACQPFIDAGFVVMAPMLRGENGNPGEFELFLGEIDDGRAAVKWLAGQPYVDAGRVYTFGHSVGGGVSAMLSLLDDVPIQHGGSSGGLYDHTTFLGWSDIVPFENTPEERTARVLMGNARHMQRRHYAYLGTQDYPFHGSAEEMLKEPGAAEHLVVEQVPGDHFTSFDGSLQRYLKVVQSGG